MTGGDLNNWLFIGAAYVSGLAMISGYALWAWRECRRLQATLDALRGVQK